MTRKKTHEEFILELEATRPILEPLSAYNGARKAILVWCRDCGNMWITEPYILLRSGCGCKYCRGIHSSFTEAFILEAFREVLGHDAVKHRDCEAIGKELDVYIPTMGFAVEPGAWVFHKDRTEHDGEKRAACEKAGIKLVTVYTGYDGPAFAEEDVIAVESDCGQLYGMPDLKQTTNRVFEMAGIPPIPDESRAWDEIKGRAIMLCGSIKKMDYVQAIGEKHPNIELLDAVIMRSQSVRARCLTCGEEWETSVDTLVRGTGCPRCSPCYRMTTEEYAAEVAKRHPEIKVLGEYRGTHRKIKARCDKGHEFSRDPLLLKRRGCPVCGRLRGCAKTNMKRWGKRTEWYEE